MNVSLNWAQDNSNVDITAIGADAVVAKIGAQLGAVENVVTWGQRYDGVIVARVESCIKHPNADKLHVCTINDGGVATNVARDEQGNVQVVCGAPNVRQGQTVAWLPPGSTVPSTVNDAEPLVLGARELRGVISNGMLASANELGISDNHDGLLEITAQDVGQELMTPGTPFKKLYSLDDTVIDCENKMFTHRPDCFGILGVARELAGIQNLPYISPDWYKNQPVFTTANDLPIDIKVETDLVPRLMAVAIKDVTVAPSPIYMQAALTRVGIRPINNLVDITNWLMHLTGQPLHAYDYDKVKAISGDLPVILARQSIKDESIRLLNDKTIGIKDDQSVMIATDKQAIGLAGVMGGGDTEVDQTTKNIILEVASFDMYNIRKTSMKYGLFTDAVTRFNKGQSPLQNDRVISKAMELVADIAGGVQASNVFDVQPQSLNANNRQTEVSLKAINTILGFNFTADDVAAILQNVEFEHIGTTDDKLLFSVPFWRMDIALTSVDSNLHAVANADIAEEIGRLYGYDKLPVTLPKRVAKAAPRNQLLSIKSTVRQKLAAMGANELLTYSFVHGDLLDKVGQDQQNAFKLGNALSPNLQYYRLSITPNLLEKVNPNIRAGYDQFALFEIGKTHTNKWIGDDNLPIEAERLALIVSASNKATSKQSSAAYYQAKKYLDDLLANFGVQAQYVAFKDASPAIIASDTVKPFLPSRSAIVTTKNGDFIGVIGEYSQTVLVSLKLPDYCAGFELDIMQLLKARATTPSYLALPKYPKVEQDISMRVNSSVSYGSLLTILQDSLAIKKPANSYAQLQPLDIYQAAEHQDTKHISFRLSIASYDQTLKADDVNNLLNDIATDASQKCDAQRI